MHSLRNLSVLILILFLPTLSGLAQSRPSPKPVIIKDTDIAEGIEVEEREVPEELDADSAEEHIDVGNFYLKKKNYAAAIGRYLSVIEYEPYSEKAYEALVKAHNTLIRKYKPSKTKSEPLSLTVPEPDAISGAIEEYRAFLRTYPDSEKREDVRKMIEELEKKKASFDNQK
jgi:outer membrane protein assembly factor BamD (BamD/ComL family)